MSPCLNKIINFLFIFILLLTSNSEKVYSQEFMEYTDDHVQDRLYVDYAMKQQQKVKSIASYGVSG